jgi:hypothetical protein
MSLNLEILQADGGKVVITGVMEVEFRNHPLKASVGVAEVRCFKGFERRKSGYRPGTDYTSVHEMEIIAKKDYEVPVSATLRNNSGVVVSTWSPGPLYRIDFITGTKRIEEPWRAPFDANRGRDEYYEGTNAVKGKITAEKLKAALDAQFPEALKKPMPGVLRGLLNQLADQAQHILMQPDIRAEGLKGAYDTLFGRMAAVQKAFGDPGVPVHDHVRAALESLRKGNVTEDAPRVMAIPEGLRQRIMGDVSIAQEAVSLLAVHNAWSDEAARRRLKDNAKAAVARIMTDITDWFNAPSPGASPDRTERVLISKPWLENLAKWLNTVGRPNITLAGAFRDDINRFLGKKD